MVMAEVTNVKIVRFGKNAHEAYGQDLYAHDYGQVIKFEGIENLPTAYEVHFGDNRFGEGLVRVGNADGVKVPSRYLDNAGTLYAWIQLHFTDEDGTTPYLGIFTVKPKVYTPGEDPDPEEQSAVSQAIIELNKAVVKTGQDVEAANAAKDAAAESARNAAASEGVATDKATEADNSAKAAAKSLEDTNAAGEQILRNANQIKTETNEIKTATEQIKTQTNEIKEATSRIGEQILENASAIRDETKGYRNEAQTAKTKAEEAAEKAEYSANVAGYMDFYIDQNGCLIYRHTKNLDNVSFELREGVLYAVWP